MSAGVKGRNSVIKIDFSLSFATGFNSTGKNDWIQTRIGIPKDVFGICSILEDIFGNSKTLTKISGNPFIPTECRILESAIRMVIVIFKASQPFPVIVFCAKYVPVNKRKTDGNGPERSSAPCMAVIEERMFQCSLSPRLPGSAGSEQYKRCGGRLVKVDLWTPPQ